MGSIKELKGGLIVEGNPGRNLTWHQSDLPNVVSDPYVLFLMYRANSRDGLTHTWISENLDQTAIETLHRLAKGGLVEFDAEAHDYHLTESGKQVLKWFSLTSSETSATNEDHEWSAATRIYRKASSSDAMIVFGVNPSVRIAEYEEFMSERSMALVAPGVSHRWSSSGPIPSRVERQKNSAGDSHIESCRPPR